MVKTIIGADPGTKGGMAVMDLTAGNTITAMCSFQDLKVDEVIPWMRHYGAAPAETVVYLEKVNYRPGDGGKGSFTFGKIYGGLLFGFKCLGVRVVPVSPMMWMHKMECMTGGNKNVTLNKAKALWPRLFEGKTKEWGLGMADALLITDFGRRMEMGHYGKQ